MLRHLAVVLLAALVWLLPWPVAAAERVTAVQAETFAQSNLPPLVAERMNRSVAAIAGQLLEGKDVAAAEAAKGSYAEVIHEVFDKVLVGYTVGHVSLDIAPVTTVRVELMPWSETIRSVQVDTAVEGMPPRIERLVRTDLAGVEGAFRETLTGLPTAAADWTNGILKQHVNAYLAEHLPEFRADFDLLPEPEAKVKLTVYPRLPVVRTVDLSMRSDTLPNSILLARRDLMQNQVNDIVGVPVGFVRRHREELAAQFASSLDSSPEFSLLKMRTRVEIEPAERSHIMSRSDTSRYRLRLSGWLDVGRHGDKSHDSDKNMLLRLHAGQMLSSRDELFLLIGFWPEKVSWDYQLGYRYDLHGGRQLGLRYDLRQKSFIYTASQQLSARWLLRYEYRRGDHLGEAAVRYRLHDFLSMEYVFDHDQNWLRLIGNF
ncbi:hypothetical protein SAMN05216582_1099 [Selenomonas ruminantium]|uniref:Acylphosphatase n=1 Tax=Selenomonas ruminantium TaxID=971 RepID=A0A1M6TSA3_SELRU|nr:acylphosphatase [Selenomonas ruminantium]SHK59793.1 hypothetical protein SAMN05216582_1099 [Selenomonas ruminantium]